MSENTIRGVDPARGGPYVQVAAFCENVIEAKDGVFSLIQIVDTVISTVQGTAENLPKQMPPFQYNLKLVLMLKSGEARGGHEIKIIPQLPTGETKSPFIHTMYFDGEEKGQNLIINFVFVYQYEGLYWFNVYFNDLLLTRLPLRVKYHKLVVPHQ